MKLKLKLTLNLTGRKLIHVPGVSGGDMGGESRAFAPRSFQKSASSLKTVRVGWKEAADVGTLASLQ